MRGRIGVIHPYWSFWEKSGGSDFNEKCLKSAVRVDNILASYGTVVWSLCLEPDDSVSVTLAEVDTIVIAFTIACPPTSILGVLERFPRATVLIWAAFEDSTLPPDFGHIEITRRGASVGAPMLGASLSKLERAFDVVAASFAGGLALERAVDCAVAAGQVRHSRIAVIGTELAGYDFTSLTEAGLERIGVTIVSIDEPNVSQRVLAEVKRAPASLSRAEANSRAYCAVISALSLEQNLNAGTLNCHSRFFRNNFRIGSAPCLALGDSTTDGVPWTCTGDVSTVFAMLVVSALGGSTFYHEIEAIDFDRDLVVLANTGEHDGRFRTINDLERRDNPWYPACREGTGAEILDVPATLISSATISAGPASLVAAGTQGTDITLTVAEGSFTGDQFPETGTMHAGFRFGAGPVNSAWQRWALSGVGHHSCATDRHIATDLQIVARHLKLKLNLV